MHNNPIGPTTSDHAEHNKENNVFGSIRALDTGINNHETWISLVQKSLVCGVHHTNPNDLCDDAHCHCKFGKWLYSSDTDSLKNSDYFQAVVEQHQKMHSIARGVLIKGEERTAISEDEYRKFTSQATDFKLSVRNLQYELMSQVCVIDHLTGVWNRYAMYSKLHQEKERQIRSGHSCSICMMDLDHFKHINDNHGHIVGDEVLKGVANICRTGLRKYDSIYRYGGEEFLFCLPDAEIDEAKIVIERLCEDLEKQPIPLPNGETISVTASFGISHMSTNLSVEDAIQAADHALLCAKAQGRNRVCCWKDGLSEFEQDE